MLTGRAWALLGGGLLLYIASRFVGAPDLHMVAVGLVALVPVAAVLIRWTRHDLEAVRRLSTRRAFPGSRIRIDLEIHNAGSTRTSFVLLEDRLPPDLGPPSRAVVADIAPGARRTVSHEVIARRRGRYPIGPLRAYLADPFDLVRNTVVFPVQQDLIVYPEVEDLGPSQVASPIGSSGESSTRQMFRSAEEFYTMRQYEIGDDLRRIHWPSVARTGQLMIRQDEASRRASAALFLDTRESAVGRSTEAFERAVSAAASIGAHYLRSGYRLRLVTPESLPRPVDLDGFLERLALVRPSTTRVLTPSLQRLRSLASGGAALVVVTHIPDPAELAELSRLGAGYGPKLAVLVHPRDPDELYLEPRREIDRQAESARTSMARAKWDVLLIRPNGRLQDVWPLRANRPARGIAASW